MPAYVDRFVSHASEFHQNLGCLPNHVGVVSAFEEVGPVLRSASKNACIVRREISQNMEALAVIADFFAKKNIYFMIADATLPKVLGELAK